MMYSAPLSLSYLQVHGRHVAVPRMVSGAYAQEYGQAEEMEKALLKVKVSEKPLQHNVCNNTPFFLSLLGLELYRE